MKFAPLAIALSLVAALGARAFPQDGGSPSTSAAVGRGSTPPSQAASLELGGEAVADIGNSCWYVFQDKSGNHWFGSDGNGVCRYDGKTLTRFTTRHGLAHDQVRGIQQHLPTGHILITTNGGVSMFDGERMVTLPVRQMEAPALPLEANDLRSAGWVLNDTDTWLSGAGGPRRYDGTTLYQLTLPPSPFEKELTASVGPRSGWASDVWTVYKDGRGHLWFGTGAFGVCRFDGQSLDWLFERHLTEVPGGGWFGFRSIIEDREGDFWFCNTQYRYTIEPHGAPGQEDGKITYTRKKGMDLAGNATTDKCIYYQSITQDDNRDLWMAPYAGGVWKYDGKGVTHVPMQVGDPAEEITMFTIYKDNRGELWVGTHRNGAYKYNGKAFERFTPSVGPVAEPQRNDPYFTPTGAKSTPSMPRVIIRSIREDRAGNIWFATFGGPIRYDGKTFTNFAEEVGLMTTRIFSLLEDRRGVLWFGSITGGASSYDGQSFRKFTEKDGLASNDVHWMFEDRDGNIWFGTTKGVSRFDGTSFTTFTTKDGLLDDAVYTIGQDAAGRMWFGTQGGICSYDGKAFTNFADQVGRSFENIRAMAVDRSGNLWFGGQDGAYRYDGTTLTTYTSKNGLLEDFVGSMLVDRAGNVWFGHPVDGAQRGGASKFDGTSFTYVTERDGLSSGNVYALGEDKAGNIWFGTLDEGACRYDGKSFTNFSATDATSGAEAGRTE